MNNISPMKKVFAVFFALLGLAGLILLIFMVGQRQDQRSRADKATVITFDPVSREVAPEEQFDLDIKLNPGSNQVSIVELVINYDEDTLTFEEDGFVKKTSKLDLITDPVVENGEIKLSMSLAGGNATNVISSSEVLGTISFTVNSDAETGISKVSVNDSKTEVRSLLGRDKYSENVLSSGGSANIEVTGGVCKPNIGKCSWDPVSGATSYKYIIFEGGKDDEELASIVEDETTKTSVEFPTKPGLKYTCRVTAVSDCGAGKPAEGTSTCPTPTPTVTPTTSPSPSPSVTASPSPTTPPSVTVVVSQPPEVVEVETPGEEVIVEVPGEQVVVTVTPAPSLPPTGNPVVMGGVVGGLLFVLGGLALLFL